MRVLLLGGSGMLGTDIAASAPEGITVSAPRRPEVDLTQAETITGALDRVAPAWVINAAAYTAVDRAEEERPAADAVNAVAPRMLGAECARRGVRVVHFGTDYVFDGEGRTPYSETDPVKPVNAYGQGKLDGERALIDSGADVLVLRIQWLFGSAGRSFPRTMWERARAGMRTRVVDDQVGRPTSTVDLAAAMWQLVAIDASGLFHAANAGPHASWFDVAREVFHHARADEMLERCSTADYPTPARRPAFSVLDTSRLEKALETPLPDWRISLRRFLTRLDAEVGVAAAC